MPYRIKRIALRSGEVVTERELDPGSNVFDGEAPVVGDVVTVTCRGRTFPAKVIWGNWPGRNDGRDPAVTVPLRVEEL